MTPAIATVLDAELAHWVEAEGLIATALVELESHRGHRLLSSSALTGQTAARWAVARETLTGLWRDFGVYQTTVAAARAVRARRSRPGDWELTRLRRLLLEPSVEVACTMVALPASPLAGGAEKIEKITLEQLSARMDASLRQVSDVMTCDELHQSFHIGLGPLAGRIQAARELARDLRLTPADPPAASLARLTTKIDDFYRACTTDLDTELTGVSTRLAELRALRDSWETRVAQLAARLDEIEELREREAHTRRHAQNSIADAGLTAPPDRLPALREWLAALRAPTGWPARAAALTRLNAAADTAAQLRAACERAGGLRDRRAELRGRFEAYRAKAIRLGHAEHPDALALDENLRRLLWTRPCDLAAATRALAAYQRLTRGTSGPEMGESA